MSVIPPPISTDQVEATLMDLVSQVTLDAPGAALAVPVSCPRPSCGWG